MRRSAFAAGGSLIACAAIVGCGLTLDNDPPDSRRGDAGVVDAGTGGSDSGRPGIDSGPGGPPDAGPSDGGPDTGPPPCGPSDLDGDQYGIEPGCLAPDCVEGDPAIGDTHSSTCYSGPTGLVGIGVCTGGTQTCDRGVWSACFGERLPSGESCNGLDDDCNGSVDELPMISCGVGVCRRTIAACARNAAAVCMPGMLTSTVDGCPANGVDEDCDGATDEDCSAAYACVRVAPGGVDATADGVTRAFGTISGALAFIERSPAAPRRVCVAQGPTCTAGSMYNDNVDMRDGIDVYGGYETTTWTRCRGGQPLTVINPARAQGLVFGPAISSLTRLDFFRVNRAAPSGSTTSAAITVEGATHVVISNVQTTNTVAVETSVGVYLSGGAEATIQRSWIYGGGGTALSAGIKVVGASVTVSDNCDSYDSSGRCNADCNAAANRGVGGLLGFTATSAGGAMSYGVLLEGLTGPARIERSAICGHQLDRAAAVHVSGDATGLVIRASNLLGFNSPGRQHAIHFESCAGAAPLVIGNFRINSHARPTSTATAILSEGDCHPVITGNEYIQGDVEGSMEATAVDCGAGTFGTPSRCVVSSNLHVEGTSFGGGVPMTAVGIRCREGGCARIEDNLDVLGVHGVSVVGLELLQSSPFVADNRISGGCSTTGPSTGVVARDSSSRLENNVIAGGFCGDTDLPFRPTTYVGMRVEASTAGVELDVNGNAIGGGGGRYTCLNTAIQLGGSAIGGVAAGPSGIYRNNIIRTGFCSSDEGVVELGPAADPRVFEYSFFDETDADPSTMVYYRDEMTMSVAPPFAGIGAALINGDPLWGGTGWWGDGLVQPTSPVRGAGTAVGMPRDDRQEMPRDPAGPDIGADEI